MVGVCSAPRDIELRIEGKAVNCFSFEGVTMQIIIADDHPVVLMGVRALFNGQGGSFEIAGEALSGSALLSLLSTVPCDLLITDFSMPDTMGSSDGLPLLKRVRRDYPALPVIVLTMVRNQALIASMFRAGVNGVVDKTSLVKELVLAVAAVTSGRRYLSDELRAAKRSSSTGMVRSVSTGAGGAHVSPREIEVIRLYATGLSVTQIAEKLQRSVKTISQQKNDAMRKLGITRNTDLYEYAKTADLIT
jgi:two-component system capsular synthesis response regulator RcsB